LYPEFLCFFAPECPANVIRDDGLTGQAKLARRQEQSKPVLERFFTWIDEQFDKQGFLPSSPFLGSGRRCSPRIRYAPTC